MITVAFVSLDSNAFVILLLPVESRYGCFHNLLLYAEYIPILMSYNYIEEYQTYAAYA